MARVRSRRTPRFSPLLVAGCSLGCVSTSAGPRGPLPGHGAQFAVATVAAFGSGSAQPTVEDPTLPERQAVASPFALLPGRAEFRFAPLDWADWGGDIGWLGSGFDLRVGIPATTEQTWIGNIALGVRSSRVAPVDDPGETGSVWGRLEAYPRLLPGDGRFVLALALHHGTFNHSSEVGLDRDGAGLWPSWGYSVVRRELRLETAVGYYWGTQRSSAMIVVEPYFVLDAGEPLRPEGVRRYSQSFGLVVVFRGALLLLGERVEH